MFNPAKIHFWCILKVRNSFKTGEPRNEVKIKEV